MPIAPILPSSRRAIISAELIVEVDDLVALGLQSRPEVEPSQIHHGMRSMAELREIGLYGGAQFGWLLRCGNRNRAR